MKYTEAPKVAGRLTLARLELTRRNLETLLEKLDDPLSQRTLIDPDNKIAVTAVVDPDNKIEIVAVENDYHDRAPGQVYMPSTGETK